MLQQTKGIVLVVEDEPVLRMLAVDLVEQAGYEAVEAPNADAAVAILEGRLDIRLVFTDIDMPGSMNGLKLAACIRDRWPPISLIITSGKTVPPGDSLPAGAVFIPKPLDFDRLTLTLERLAA